MQLLAPKYSKPLQEWIALALNKSTLEEVVSGIRARASPGKLPTPPKHNSRYLTKILDEEVRRQFRHNHRPLVELVTNAIDARPENPDDYRVDVKIRLGGHFVVEDRGRSMTLDQLLTMLIIPFSTDKDPAKDIGRFGVGFLSALNYCLLNPKDSVVRVTCYHEAESYRFEFSSRGAEVSGLVLAISPVTNLRKRRGTTVRVEACISGKNRVKEYLSEQLGEFSPRRAQIYLNRRLLNPEFAGSSYYLPQSFTVRGQPVQQDVGVIINTDLENSPNGQLILTSQGIHVVRGELAGANVKVDFPPAVLIVEGRDEFKIDHNYQAALEKVFELMHAHISQNRGNTALVQAMRDTVASMAGSLGMKSSAELPHFNEIFEALFQGAKYIIPQRLYGPFLRFFGEGVAPQFYAFTPIGEAFWRKQFMPYQEFLKQHSKELAAFSYEEIQGFSWLSRGAADDFTQHAGRSADSRRHHLQDTRRIPNLAFLVNNVLAGYIPELDAAKAVRYVPVESDLNSGASPFLLHDGQLLINTSNPLLHVKGSLNAYRVSQTFAEAFLTPEKAERALWGHSNA